MLNQVYHFSCPIYLANVLSVVVLNTEVLVVVAAETVSPGRCSLSTHLGSICIVSHRL